MARHDQLSRLHVPAHTSWTLITGSTWLILLTALGKSTTTGSRSATIYYTVVMEMLSTLVIILGQVAGSSMTGWTNWPTARAYLTKYGYNTEDKSLDIK